MSEKDEKVFEYGKCIYNVIYMGKKICMLSNTLCDSNKEGCLDEFIQRKIKCQKKQKEKGK